MTFFFLIIELSPRTRWSVDDAVVHSCKKLEVLLLEIYICDVCPYKTLQIVSATRPLSVYTLKERVRVWVGGMDRLRHDYLSRPLATFMTEGSRRSAKRHASSGVITSVEEPPPPFSHTPRPLRIRRFLIHVYAYFLLPRSVIMSIKAGSTSPRRIIIRFSDQQFRPRSQSTATTEPL